MVERGVEVRVELDRFPEVALGDLHPALLEACRRTLPLFMVPHHIAFSEALPRNPNGKYDRTKLAAEFKDLFREAKS